MQEYVKHLKITLAREDGDQLQQCLSIDPNIIPGGQRLLTTTFANVRLLTAATLSVSRAMCVLYLCRLDHDSCAVAPVRLFLLYQSGNMHYT